MSGNGMGEYIRSRTWDELRREYGAHHVNGCKLCSRYAPEPMYCNRCGYPHSSDAVCGRNPK